MIRTFIAIKIPCSENLQQAFSEIKMTLDKDQVKWTDPAQLHITLKFLGDTEEDLVPGICETLKNISATVPVFPLVLQGTGLFRSFNDPRVFWIGIKEEGKYLQMLKAAIEKSLTDYGFMAEEKPFVPHLTLGRIKQLKNKTGWQRILEKTKDIIFQETIIDSIIFYKSVLTASGPVYSELDTIRLTGGK